jgi:antitoxin ParD1/3/4
MADSEKRGVEKISVALTPEMAAMLRDVVEKGEYATASEVVREALRGWEFKRRIREQRLSELRAEIQKGLDSGDGGELDVEEIIKEAEEEMRQDGEG